MKKIRNLAIILSTLLAFILLVAVLYYSMSFSANSAMRRTIFLDGHPIEAFTASLPGKPTDMDKRYGICYDFSDPLIADGTENSIPGICMKKNKFGMYYDISIGTL